MDMQTFTEKSREALSEAQTLALRLGHQEVDAEHLAVALAVQDQGLVPRIMSNLSVDAVAYADAVSAELRKRPSVSGPGVGGQMAMTRRLGQVLIRARDFSLQHRSSTCKQPSRYLTIQNIGPNVSGQRHSCR